jgi:D-amino-acid dehydrogenase
VLERDQIGKGASYGNAGSIAPGHPPINKPGRVRQALKSLFDPLSPLYVAPRPDPALAKWLWAFRRTCTDRHVELCMRTLAPLGHATRELFDELVETENLECCFHRAGYSEIYLTERGLESARKEASVISRYGFHPEVMPGGALRECEPAINGRIVGGIFHPEAATINPYHFVLEMAKRAERYGAELRTGTQVVALRTMDRKVRGVQTQNGELMEADSVVVAGGGCLQHAAHPGAWRKLPFAAGEGLSPRLRIRGGQASASAARLRARGEHGILHTQDDPTVRSEWCSLRPRLPDGMPAVGPLSPYSGLFIATGHAMMGLTLGPVTGKLIAEYILDGLASMDITALSPSRF